MKNSKRVVALIMALLMSVSVAGCESKQEATTDQAPAYEYVFRDLKDAVYITAAESFEGGSGTQDDPYLIADAAQLSLFSDIISSDEVDREMSEGYYKLTNDIVINEGDASIWGENPPQYSFRPIGESGMYLFSGEFDGDGHTISGVYMNRDSNDTNDKTMETGLFANNNGVIKNLNIKNSYVCVSGYTQEVGALVGENRADGVVENCQVECVIECYDATCGGVVGLNNGEISDSSFSGTINQLKDGTFNILGGIAGTSSKKVDSCKNYGTIVSDITAADCVGGIVGRLNDGSVVGCENNGAVQCANGEIPQDATLTTSTTRAGGIVGLLFSSSAGGDEYANKEIDIISCVNNGEVAGGMSVAGIAAEASNYGSDYPVTIDKCTNNGNIISHNDQGGIVARVACTGVALTISNCTNTVDLKDASAGGIIGSLTPTSGDITVSNCVNEGDVEAVELYVGGIINSMYIFSDVDSVVNIDNCTNKGKLTTTNCAGGIIGFINSTGTGKISDRTAININKCFNSGEMYTTNNNTYLGGIVGGCGCKDINVRITDCFNTGKMTVEQQEPEKETIEGEKELNLTRMCGGIVGRVGESLFLSTSGDQGDKKNVNSEDAMIVILGCYNNCEFDVPAEDLYKYKDGKNVWDNELGGIVGNCSAEDGFAFRVENCGFVTPERGLGSKGYDDIGSAVTQQQFETALNSKISNK